MPNPPLPQSLKPSVLDRLIDACYEGSRAPTWYDAQGVIASVRRDLEDLLNTRQTHQGLCDGFPELENSLITFGLPDAASLLAVTPQQRLALGRRIEQIITRFEPRLKQVRVIVSDAIDPRRRVLEFAIHGRLQIEPAVDLELNAALELTTGQLSVSAGPR
jgi:type VI secretion system protein ImpF